MNDFQKQILFPGLILVVIFLFFYSSMQAVLETYGGNYSGLLRLRERRVDKVPFLTEDLQAKLILKDKGGYDGQWFYYMSFDPFLTRFKDDPVQYRQVVDAPPYRFGRIGFPWLVRLLSGNNPHEFPRAMIHLILYFHLIGALFLIKILTLLQKSQFWSLLYILIPGFSTSLNLGLPEPIVSALLLGGVYCYLNQRWIFAALFFSYAVLTRETAAILILVLLVFELLPARKLKSAIIIALSLLPYFVWKLFLTYRLFPDYGWQTIVYTPGDFTFPFGGIIDVYHNWEKSSRNPGLLVYPVFMVLNLVFGGLLIWRKQTIFSIALLGYTLLYTSLNHIKIWGHIRDVERISNEGYWLLFLASMFLPRGTSLWLRYGFVAVFVLLLIYDLFFASIAPYFRAGLFLTGLF